MNAFWSLVWVIGALLMALVGFELPLRSLNQTETLENLFKKIREIFFFSILVIS